MTIEESRYLALRLLIARYLDNLPRDYDVNEQADGILAIISNYDEMGLLAGM